MSVQVRLCALFFEVNSPVIMGSQKSVDKHASVWYNILVSYLCRCGGIGRHKGLKIPRWQQRTGSSPVSGTSRDGDSE